MRQLLYTLLFLRISGRQNGLRAFTIIYLIISDHSELNNQQKLMLYA